MNNILITIDNGFSARYFIGTGLINKLISELNGKIIICTKNISQLNYLKKKYKTKIKLICLPDIPEYRFRSTLINYISIINSFGMPHDKSGSATWVKNKLYFKKNKIGLINTIVLKVLIKIFQHSILFRNITNQIHFNLLSTDNFKDILKQNNINTVVLDGLSNFSPGHSYWIKASKELEKKSVTIITNWDHSSSRGYVGLKSEYYYVWGKSMEKELLRFHDIPSNKIKIVGSCLFDLYSDNNFIKPSLIINKNKKKCLPEKYILFATHSPTYRNNLNIVKYLRENINNDISIVIRPHPSYLYPIYKKRLTKHIKFSNESDNMIYSFPLLENNTMPTNMSFNEIQISSSLIANAHIVINFGSTLLLDSLICGRYIINLSLDWNLKDKESPLRPSTLKFRHHLSRAIHSKNIYNINYKNELIPLINRLIKMPINKFIKPLKTTKIILKECGLIDGNTNRRIAKLLLND